MHRVVAILFAVYALLVASPARADDALTCRSGKETPDAVIAACTRLIESRALNKVNLALSFNSRGEAYSKTEAHDRAIADFSETLRLLPHFAPAFYRRGVAYEQVGQIDKAIADYRRARYSGNAGLPNPTRDAAIKALQRLGITDNDLRRLAAQDQIARYNQRIELNPNDPGNYSGRCSAYLEIGDQDRALADCDQAVRLRPDWLFYSGRAHVYSAKGEHDLALADIDEAIRLKPDAATMITARGNIYVLKGEYNRAIAEYNEAIRLVPTDPMAYFGRARAYDRIGQRDKAEADRRKATGLLRLLPM